MVELEAGAVLFDMDGTLVDSNQCVVRAWQAWCAATGTDLAEVLRVSHGTPCIQTIAQVAPHLDFVREAARYEAFELRFGDGQSAIAGADAVLRGLSVDRWGLVTSAAERIARFRFRHCRLPFPKVAITAESVRCGKPSPEPFLLAAERLGMAPQDCLVFEDSRAGVQAGLAAGCRVVVIGDLEVSDPQVVARIKDYLGVRLTSGDGRGIILSLAA